MIASSTTLSEKASLHYDLATIYAKIGDYNGFEQAKSFIKRYGNTMGCVTMVDQFWP